MQEGYLYKSGRYWRLRYYEPVLENGQVTRKQSSRKLALIREYPTKTEVRPLAETFLASLSQQRAESGQSVADFLENVYLPHCRETLRPSTCKGYWDCFKVLRDQLDGATLHNFKTPEADALLRAVAAKKQRAHSTHRNLKSFLSGAFRFAKRQGVVNDNPIRDVAIPRGMPKRDRAPYSLEEVTTMLRVVPEPSRTVVLVAALTGLRLSELKGLRWEDFDGDTVNIRRSVWQGYVGEPKTLTSRAPVPVVPFLLEQLEEYKKRNSGVGFVFHGESGQPIRVENLFRRQMREPLEKAGVAWRGWHCFRYGVATLLHSLGTDSKTISTILRHSNLSVTMDIYAKTLPEDARRAMMKLEAAFKNAQKKGAA